LSIASAIGIKTVFLEFLKMYGVVNIWHFPGEIKKNGFPENKRVNARICCPRASQRPAIEQGNE
jgi:hypothetical protein